MMKQIDCGPVCTEASQLEEKIIKLLSDVNYQRANYYRAREISKLNHNLQNSNRVFEGIVETAIAEYTRD